MNRISRRGSGGFTLAEAVMVIVITGIIAAIVAVFIRKPMEGFTDSTRRAALADAADTALRRISRDLHDALPNSVRVNPGGTALEFLRIRSGGRYREAVTGNAGIPGNILDFTANDTSFDVLGPGVPVQSGDSIVVYNLGIAGSNAYDTTTNPPTSRRVTSTTSAAAISITIASTTPFPFASPARRFQVVDTPVSYVCSGSQMRRYSGYGITDAQVVPPAGGSSALLVDGIATGGCGFGYSTTLSQRDALVTLTLSLTAGTETVSLVHQVHVNNAP